MRDFYGVTLANPLMLGTAQYPSPAILADAFRASKAADYRRVRVEPADGARADYRDKDQQQQRTRF